MFTLTLKVSDDVYARAQAIADETEQPIERVLENYLTTLPASMGLSAEVQEELAALPHLSDDALWTIEKSKVAPTMTAQIHGLLDLENRSHDSQAELDELLDRADRLTLRKVEAMVLLKNRGYTVGAEEFSA